MTPAEELRHLAGEGAEDAIPEGFVEDEVVYPGVASVLERAREVMTAAISGGPLPTWFTDQCHDDSAIRVCTLDRWSLRAWKFWLEPENRRWWWWSARIEGGEVRLTVLVRSRPYLRGSLDWLFRAAALA